MAPPILCNLLWERLYINPSERFGVCWCRCCLGRMVPGPWGSRGWERFVPEGTRCCEEAWLARGWFCRWCGKDGDTGTFEAARGIYGGISRDFMDMPSWCECGWELRGWVNYNLASCGSCWWACTQQLVAFFLKLLGPWSEIHDNIFLCLIEGPCWAARPADEEADILWMLEQIREFGLSIACKSVPCNLLPPLN